MTEDDPRIINLQVSVNKYEKELIEKAAEEEQRSVSQFIRIAVLDKIERIN